MSKWKQIRLGDHAETFAGGTPDRDNPRFFGGSIPWVKSTEINLGRIRETEEFLTEDGLRSSAAKWIPANTVLVALYGATAAQIAYLEIEATANQAVLAVVPDATIESVFLFYALSAAKDRILFRAQGSGQPNLNKRIIDSIRIDLPPPVEQRRIAEILSAVDEAMEQTEALIAKYQQIKAGLMHDLFTCGVTPDGQLRPSRAQAPQLYKNSPLGWIPKEWDTELLDDIALRGSGHTPNRNRADFWNGGIKWLSLADSWRLDRLYVSDTDKEISELGIANSSAVLHPPGIVVLSRDAGIGKSAITKCSMAVSQHFMCWRCGPRLRNHFLYYWLQLHKREFENIATGTTIPTIGLRYFKHYRINVPADIEEQRRIGEVLLSLDNTIFAEENQLSKLRAQKHGLMQDLLTGRAPVRVTGPTVTKD